MTTYGDRKQRLFWGQSQFVTSITRKKRSVCKLKAYNSNVDNRVWSSDQDERRRAILELVNHHCGIGGPFPVDVLLFFLCGEGGKSGKINKDGKCKDSATDAADGADAPLSPECELEKKNKELDELKHQINCFKTLLDKCRTCQDELKCRKRQLAICRTKSSEYCPACDSTEDQCLTSTLEELDKCRQELVVHKCLSPCGDVECHCLDLELPPGYIPCYKLVELLHTKASELENNCKCMGKSDCSNVETIHCRIEDEADEYCYDDSKAESSYDPCNPCSTKDFESSFLSKTDCPSDESSQHSQSCHKDTCFSNKQSSRSGSFRLGTPPKEQDKMLGQGYGHLFSDDCTSQNSSNKSDKLKEVCSLKDEIKRLKCLVEKQCHTECELEIATKTVCQLRNEIDTLQDCLSKQKKEISEMIKICDQQQGQIAFLQNVECKLKEVCKQRDELKKQIEEICSSKPTGGGVAEDIKRLKILECQKKEIEKERDSLRCKLEKLECKSIEKDNEINKLTTKANKLQEAILCLEVSPGKNRNCNTVKCCNNNNNNDDVIPKHSSSDTCFKDLKCIQDNLHSLQKKVIQQENVINNQSKDLQEQHNYILELEELRVALQNKVQKLKEKQIELLQSRNNVTITQQEKVIDSQNKCLQEQHCYILEQEELRVALRNKVKELTEQQIQLLHERNNLSSEIRSLTVKLGRSISFAEVSSQPCE